MMTVNDILNKISCNGRNDKDFIMMGIPDGHLGEYLKQILKDEKTMGVD